jgi:hypothetical protein
MSQAPLEVFVVFYFSKVELSDYFKVATSNILNANSSIHRISNQYTCSPLQKYELRLTSAIYSVFILNKHKKSESGR